MATDMKNFILRSMLLLAADIASAEPIQSVPMIEDAVAAYLSENLQPGGKYEIGPLQIDPRLQLPQCQQALQVFSQSGGIKPGRNTLGVRCQGDKGWTIYTMASIKSFKDVLVLGKSLRRGDIIQPEHLNVEMRDIGSLQQGYLSNLEDVVGKQASRAIPEGSVLNRLHYAEPALVKRGERVNIQSARAGMLISALGTAMADGVKGQKINVKNLSSQRVIQATVVETGQVSVYF